MGTARSRFFITASILMIASGLAGITALALMLGEKLHNTYSSLPVVIICSVLALSYIIINIIAGVRGLMII